MLVHLVILYVKGNTVSLLEALYRRTMLLQSIILTLLSLHSARGQFDCSTHHDGNYEIACKTYVKCVNGVATTVECQGDMVYNNVTKACDYQIHVLPPCGLVRDCAPPIKDGTYADHSLDCKSYYTCSHHTYFGHNYCTPGTVFEQTLHTCVWPADAYPPCGTKARK